MKLTLIFSMFFISTAAFASKARLISLGESSVEGSHYVEDTRSVFLNPSYVNKFNNYVVTEWGSGNTANSIDSDTAPHAEGGFFMNSENFAYGVYMGNLSKSKNSERSNNSGVSGVVTGDANFLEQDNRFDLFFGGDAGILWGIRGYYASSQDQNETSQFEKDASSYGLGIGALDELYGFYANIDLADTSRGATAKSDKWEGKLGYEVGGNYNLAGITLFAEYEVSGYEYADSALQSRLQNKESGYEFGVGRVIYLNDKSKLYARASYIAENQEFKGASSKKVESSYAPLAFAFEAEAKSWLTLRASITQYLWQDNRVSNRGINTNSTIVNAGATISEGRAKIDGLVGQDSSGNKTGTPGTFGRIAASYWF